LSRTLRNVFQTSLEQITIPAPRLKLPYLNQSTAQSTSLSQLLLDPYYRSVEGFIVLIEKEWISMGHRFARRCGHARNHDKMDNQRAPIFFQWLDCVFQLLTQFPQEFEFDSKMLVLIADELHACRFGTFFFENDL
jgi:hypothetical protein